MTKFLPLLLLTLVLACTNGNGQTDKGEIVILTASPHNLKHLYINVDNPLEVSLEGISLEEVSITVTGADFKVDGLNVSIHPTEIGSAHVLVTRGDEILKKIKWLVVDLPDPDIRIDKTLSGGGVTNLVASTFEGIDLIWDFPLPAKHSIARFELEYRPNEGEKVTYKVEGDRFSKEMKKVLSKAQVDDFFTIDNVSVDGPHRKDHEMPGPSFYIVK